MNRRSRMKIKSEPAFSARWRKPTGSPRRSPNPSYALFDPLLPDGEVRHREVKISAPLPLRTSTSEFFQIFCEQFGQPRNCDSPTSTEGDQGRADTLNIGDWAEKPAWGNGEDQAGKDGKILGV